MADNVSINPGTTTPIATDDVGGGVQLQRVKVTWGPDGSYNDTDNATNKGLPIRIVQDDVGSAVATDASSQSGGLTNLALCISEPLIFDGTNWVRGGYTPYKLIAAASTNATSVKASAGLVGGIFVSNSNASIRYLKFYNKASAPTVGTDTPVLVLLVPGNASGAGSNIPVPPMGIAFATGVAFALTTGVADSDTGAVGANDLVVNLLYK